MHGPRTTTSVVADASLALASVAAQWPRAYFTARGNTVTPAERERMAEDPSDGGRR